MLQKNIAKSEVLEIYALSKLSWSVFELFFGKNNPDGSLVPDQTLCPLLVVQGQAVPNRYSHCDQHSCSMSSGLVSLSIRGGVKLTTMSGSEPMRWSWLTSPTCLAVSARVRPTLNQIVTSKYTMKCLKPLAALALHTYVCRHLAHNRIKTGDKKLLCNRIHNSQFITPQ
ncbi:hypothetical protein Plhal304r1_c017g0061981 [Plasmopara halstedii]